MSKKVIWLINQYVTRYSDSGGTRHLDFASEWVKKGYEVHIFASGFHYNEHQEKILNKDEFYKIEKINEITVHWIKIVPYVKNNYKRFISMYSFYRNVLNYISKKNKYISTPDIVIGSSVHLLAVLAAYKISKRYNSKFIVEIRDLWPETLVQLGKISKQHIVYKFFHFLEKFLYKKADYIVTLLDRAHEYISKYTVCKIECIPNGFNHRRLEDVRCNTYKNECDNFTVLYLGTIGLADDVKTLLETAKLLKEYKNISIKIIGDGVERNKLIKFKNKNKLNNVLFENPIPKNLVLEELSKVDVVWVGMPNSEKLYKYGLSSNKIYDYMIMRKPVIISTPLKENIITCSKCGLSIPAENSQQLFNSIVQFYQMDKAQLEEYGDAGHDYIMKYFTIEKLNKKWIKIFNELL